MIAPLVFAAALAAAPAAAIPADPPDYAQVALADPAKEAQAAALMDTIRCVVCQGQPISGSNADLAADMRRMVRERIARGDSPEQVRAWLVGRYGDWISFSPRMRTATAPLWLVPLGALAGGLALVARRLRRRSTR
ncbi:MAG: cytochrome c-type biogenesis protein CcmH [Sphingomonadales bacterium]|nr:cytochrome c-type biogenesis protein CcmH [Sphingomonadales bacterium]